MIILEFVTLFLFCRRFGSIIYLFSSMDHVWKGGQHWKVRKSAVCPNRQIKGLASSHGAIKQP
jgi:hypothetical protein